MMVAKSHKIRMTRLAGLTIGLAVMTRITSVTDKPVRETDRQTSRELP